MCEGDGWVREAVTSYMDGLLGPFQGQQVGSLMLTSVVSLWLS